MRKEPDVLEKKMQMWHNKQETYAEHRKESP